MLVWTCEVCGQPISDGDGAIFADDHEVAEYEAARVAWEAEALANSPSPSLGVVTGTALLVYPEVHWQRMHYACDPVQERSSYWIDVDRIRTAKQVIWWTAHLLGKDWLTCTDWAALLEQVEPQLPG